VSPTAPFVSGGAQLQPTPWESNPVEVEQRLGNTRREHAQEASPIDHWIGAVDMSVGDFRILRRLAFLPLWEAVARRQCTQRSRDIVLI